MPRRSTDNDDADGGSAEAGVEEVERSSVAAISPPPGGEAAGAASDAAAITTTSPVTTALSAAGVELSPSSDDAPVPLAQTLAAYDEAEEGNEKPKGVEVIESSGGDVPVPVAMMDICHDLDEAEKGAAGAKMAGKSVELVDGDDEGPAPPGHTVNEGSGSKIKAKKLKAGRVRGVAPGIAAGDDDSVCEPVLEEDPAQNLATTSAPRGGRFPSRDAGAGPNARNRQREVPRPSPAEPTVPVFHEVHARLVEDEPEQPVYDAVPVGEEPWAKRHQRKITGGLVVALGALVVALGVAFGTGRGGGRLCFVDRKELKAAVDDYTAGGPACQSGASECEVVQKYGWPIGRWCVSDVTDMSFLFQHKGNFDDDLSSWDTSSVTSMAFMFMVASSFNGDVSNFDTSRVTSMRNMFAFASSFNQDVSGWDVASVTDMYQIFMSASSFNQNLCAWGAHYNATSVFYGYTFWDTNCPNQGNPQGPNTNWCAATCQEVAPTTSPRPTPSPTTMADCVAAGKQTFQVDTLTDDYPEETAYTLVNLCTGLTEASRDFATPYTLGETLYTDIHCVSDAEFTFTIYDSGNDGLCCGFRGNGGYLASYGGSVVASGGDFGSSESTTFGTCVLGNPSSPTKSPTLAIGNGQ